MATGGLIAQAIPTGEFACENGIPTDKLNLDMPPPNLQSCNGQADVNKNGMTGSRGAEQLASLLHRHGNSTSGRYVCHCTYH